MAKKKRSRGKASLLTKAINIGVLLLAFSPAIKRAMGGGDVGKELAAIYSAGLSEGSFNKAWAMEAYGPMVAAIILKKAISMVRKTARV